MDDRLTDDEVRELARVFYGPADAARLLARAGLARQRQPLWQAGNAVQFWAEVSALLDSGILENGRLRILAGAREAFPGNPVFASGAWPGPRPARGRGETGTGASPGAAAPARVEPGEWRRHALVDHDSPFGIDEIVDTVATTLCSPSAGQLVSLFGEGGIGKTTVAYEVAGTCAATGHFARMAWASAKHVSAAMPGESVPGVVGANWLDVVRSIAVQLGLDLGVSKALWENEVSRGLRRLTADRAFLVVVDNLESTEDAQDAVERLMGLGLTGQHRVVVTTRWSVQTGFSPVQEFRVRRMRNSDAMALIRHLGRSDGDLMSAPEEQLLPVLEVTEGNPYLIKLVVKHYLASHRSLDLVLDDLRDLADESTGGSPALGDHAREHLYLRSLAELGRRCGDEAAEQLMFCFCLKEKGGAATYEELLDNSGIGSEPLFRATLESACRLALVRASDMNRRYSIHGLLHEFTSRQLGLTSPLGREDRPARA
ncbi:effector-associated domain EAD1-containing protein [Frankia sp. CcI49]|uniref:effector-associated domain EAD1-containing protein n=1 Tax=Frankia sp. CcI49 TaxID=1745382 RepID=UPI0010566EDD|nr:effector-associated domain EAD1-containing protein [Frankia sp. CcI49]